MCSKGERGSEGTKPNHQTNGRWQSTSPHPTLPIINVTNSGIWTYNDLSPVGNYSPISHTHSIYIYMPQDHGILYFQSTIDGWHWQVERNIYINRHLTFIHSDK